MPEKEFQSKRSTRIRPARLIWYDSGSKSSGVTAKAFDSINKLLAQALDAIVACPCSQGCPSCVASSACTQGNLVMSKLGARVVLECLLGRTIDMDTIPMQTDALGGAANQTVEAVPPVRAAEDVVRRECMKRR